MKKAALLILTAFTLFACSKSSSDEEPEAQHGTVLLKRVTEVVRGDSTINVEFTYDGTRLTYARYVKNPDSAFLYEQGFTYNTQGQLTGMVSYPSWGSSAKIRRAIVNYTGNNVSEINFTMYDDRKDRVLFTFANGRLISKRQDYNDGTSTYEESYTYDNNGRNTKRDYVNAYIAGNGAEYYTGTYTFSNFDDKKTVLSALPNQEFFTAYAYDMHGVYENFGNNNPSNGQLVGTGDEGFPINQTYTYTYTYNSLGYPATMTKKLKDGATWKFYYDYIEVK